MTNGIRVSEKHGLNPSLKVCFWCGKETGEILLMGRMKGDIEAPRRTFTDYNPCPECQKLWELGGVVIETTEAREDGPPPMTKDGRYAPTGRSLVIKREAFEEMFNHPSANVVLVGKKVYNEIIENNAAPGGGKEATPQ